MVHWGDRRRLGRWNGQIFRTFQLLLLFRSEVLLVYDSDHSVRRTDLRNRDGSDAAPFHHRPIDLKGGHDYIRPIGFQSEFGNPVIKGEEFQVLPDLPRLAMVCMRPKGKHMQMDGAIVNMI